MIMDINEQHVSGTIDTLLPRKNRCSSWPRIPCSMHLAAGVIDEELEGVCPNSLRSFFQSNLQDNILSLPIPPPPSSLATPCELQLLSSHGSGFNQMQREFAALPGAALDQSMTHEGERNLNFFAQGQDYSAVTHMPECLEGDSLALHQRWHPGLASSALGVLRVPTP